MGNNSCSCICVTSLPRTVIRPESGGNRPSANFKIVLLPEPATPNRAFVSPKGNWNETPRRTWLSPKERCTSSKTTAAPEGAVPECGGQSRVGDDMLVIGQH